MRSNDLAMQNGPTIVSVFVVSDNYCVTFKSCSPNLFLDGTITK